ncbi:jg9913 [Pararge aegeria aegeria]|uniref:Jg9913 protein n=1 Tax=Pararge aegeria aegeria TaxID=348720 RepID=A0A8S4R9X1_9NEOP|nr:jg9913 [Pararge aegeria aegeria]
MNGGAPLAVSYAAGSRGAAAAFTPPPACGPAVYEPAAAAARAPPAPSNTAPTKAFATKEAKGKDIEKR